jgi:hypothetical protein
LLLLARHRTALLLRLISRLLRRLPFLALLADLHALLVLEELVPPLVVPLLSI